MNLAAIKGKIPVIVKKLQAIFKKDFVVGLDVGSSSVKIVQFIKREDGLHLIKAGLEEIAQVKDEAWRGKGVIIPLKNLLRGVDFKKSKFVVAINCGNTALRSITTPFMPRAELKTAITLEAKNYFPFSVDEAFLDFEILDTMVEKGIKKYKVLVATSPKKTVARSLSLLDGVGIKPAAFITTCLALKKTVENTASGEEEVKAFLDIGKQFSELAIFSGKELVFSRKIPVAGDDFTEAMTGVLVSDKGKTQLTIEEAEKIKREVGLPLAGEPKMVEDKISTTQIMALLRTPAEQLVNEIDRCFDYYREETKGREVASLVLFGGGALLKGLDKFISQELSLEVKAGNPLGGFKKEPETASLKEVELSRLNLAIGAALSQAKGINLLPPEVKHETKRMFKRTTLRSIIISTVLILSFIYIGMKIQLGNFQKRIKAATLELGGLRFGLAEAKKQSLANSLLASEPFWEDVFIEVSNIIPDEIYLTHLSKQGSRLKLKGVVESKEEGEIISKFMFGLEKGVFNHVKLISSRDLTTRAANEFELECGLD